MVMKYQQQYREDELEKIVFETQIYMCACPSQVASEILRLRELIDYQHTCEREVTNASITHQTIAHAAIQAHALMEDCLTQVLTSEGWDRQTLKIPEGLRKRRDDFLTRPLSHDGMAGGFGE
jgi:hypothetical protein